MNHLMNHISMSLKVKLRLRKDLSCTVSQLIVYCSSMQNIDALFLVKYAAKENVCFLVRVKH